MAHSNLEMAEIGALIGDPARANILAALCDGRALTATELSYVARVTPQTTSGHLAKLAAANLLALARQGRHRYYRLASPLVAQMLESIMAVAALQLPPRRRLPSRIDDEMRMARTCYDHLAGRLGVAVTDAMTEAGVLDQTRGFALTPTGLGWLTDTLGVTPEDLRPGKRPLARGCLDWTERRQHLAGTAGAKLCQKFFDNRWLARVGSGRAVRLTLAGEAALRDLLGLSGMD
jgi:DNA-binding transcriptional ArsR family regulator